MASSAPTLPHPTVINGLNHIPPPPVASFDDEFGGLLPLGVSLTGSWGITRYYDFSPDAPLSAQKILLIHGVGTPALGLAPLALKLSNQGYHIVTYDLYGHGLSSTPLATHTPALMHHQVLELLSHLRWTSCHMVGFSLGGAIATTFSALRPEAVQSLVLIAPAGLWRKADRSWWEWLTVGGFDLPGFEYLRRRNIMAYINGGVSPEPKDDGWKDDLKKGVMHDTTAIEKWEREQHGGHVATVVSLWNYTIFDQHDSYQTLNEGLLGKKKRVLVVLAEEDGSFELGFMKKEFKTMQWKGKVEVIEGAGHACVRSHIKEVVGLLEGFWEGLDEDT